MTGTEYVPSVSEAPSGAQQTPYRRAHVLKNEAQSELTRMNNLNSRFMNFLDMVKLETKRSESLKSDVTEQKQEIIRNLDTNMSKYRDDLLTTKQYLNEITLSLNSCQVTERSSRIKAEWFAKLLKFEMENLNQRPNINLVLNNNLNFNYQINRAFDRVDRISAINGHEGSNQSMNDSHFMSNNHSSIDNGHCHSSTSGSSSGSSDNSTVSEDDNAHNFSLSNSSNISSSQTSLTSSISLSASSSSVSESSETSSPTNTSPAAPQCIITDTQIQLESYLSNTKSLRVQLESDYEKKVREIFENQEKNNKLTRNLSELNSNLDGVKTDNCNLEENVKNLRRELDFYRRLNMANDTSTRKFYASSTVFIPDRLGQQQQQHQLGNSSSTTSLPSTKPPTESKEEAYPIKDDAWFTSELDRVKREAIEEFEYFNQVELAAYEEQLEADLLKQLELHELEFNSEADRIDAESDSILNELEDLTTQLKESALEHDKVSKENQILNDRLISLSNSMCSFNDLSANDQDCLITNYSIRALEKEIAQTKEDIKSHKKELGLVKGSLVQKDIIDLLEPSEQILLNPRTNPWLSPSSLILKQHYSEHRTQHDMNPLPNQSQSPQRPSQEIKYELNIRPYSSQIEYTKSNLFAYLKLDFDLTRSYYTTSSSGVASKQKPTTNHTNLNCLRIAMDSIDGHSIVIENSHKILDFDLSDWTLRREIQNYPNFNMSGSADRVCVPFKIPVEGDVKLIADNDSKLIDVIEFKFPKGFKLKRRKKVNLIAAGGNKLDSGKFSKMNSMTNISSSCNSLNEVGNSTPQKAGSKSTLNKRLNASNGSLANNVKNNIFPSITMNKCACCSCKLLTTRQGDVDIFEVKDVPTWGTGLLVVTKFINSKNVTKLVNYKCLKHIWVNNNVTKENSSEQSSDPVASSLLEELGF